MKQVYKVTTFTMFLFAFFYFGHNSISVLSNIYYNAFCTHYTMYMAIAMVLAYSLTLSVMVASIHLLSKRRGKLLSCAAAFGGDFALYWQVHYPIIFSPRHHFHFNIGGQYSVLFITAIAFLLLHFSVCQIRRTKAKRILAKRKRQCKSP